MWGVSLLKNLRFETPWMENKGSESTELLNSRMKKLAELINFKFNIKTSIDTQGTKNVVDLEMFF